MSYRKEVEGKDDSVRNLEDLWGALSTAEVERIKSYWKLRLSQLTDKGVYFLALIAIVPILFVAGAVFFHFQLGGDLPWLEVKNFSTAAHWGQIGDFVGGILNPFLSFAALIAVIYSLRTQGKELALAREDAKENHRIQVQQSQIFEKQNFESVFFRLLDIHARLTNELVIEYTIKDYNTLRTATVVGMDAFKFICKEYFPKGTDSDSPDLYEMRILGASRILSARYQRFLAHYFRNLYQILKQIDSLGMDPLRLSRSSSMVNVRAWVENYNTQRNYSNMLRAQLSSVELNVILLNCLTGRGKGMKYYVERFSLLKHIDKDQFGPHFSRCSNLIDDLAFADSEEIHAGRLQKHIRARVRSSNENSKQRHITHP